MLHLLIQAVKSTFTLQQCWNDQFSWLTLPAELSTENQQKNSFWAKKQESMQFSLFGDHVSFSNLMPWQKRGQQLQFASTAHRNLLNHADEERDGGCGEVTICFTVISPLCGPGLLCPAECYIHASVTLL